MEKLINPTYLPVTEEVREKVREGLEKFGSKGNVAWEMGYRSTNRKNVIYCILNGVSKTIRRDAYVRLLAALEE